MKVNLIYLFIYKMWFCYLLICGNLTYIGATVDPQRRLRQHNKEISGGAKYTTSKVTDHQKWSMHCYVEGFPDERCALQFEWMWKYRSKKLKGSPLQRRLNALYQILCSGKSTSESLNFVLYHERGGYYPQIVYL